ncbi:MAG: hypothetical protein MR380_02145 [Lachnospiraceae bacterium]|nr:hypothetical protein [Lachnospiraceae bacterium]
MKKVKEWLKELEKYVNSEHELIKDLVDAGIYDEGFIAKQRKYSHERIKAKQAEYKVKIDQHIEEKISAVTKENTYSADIMEPVYQAYQSNVLAKIQLLCNEITEEMLKGMIQPIADRKDNSTLEAIRSAIQSKQINNDDTKKKLLQCIPRYNNKAELLKEAKKMIDHLIDSDVFENSKLEGAIGIKYLEQSGVFDI